MDIQLKDGERLDELDRNGYRIIQDPKRFCFGMDAVLLAGFAKVKPGERYWIWGPGPVFCPSFWKPERKEYPLPVWRFSRRVRTWPPEASV